MSNQTTVSFTKTTFQELQRLIPEPERSNFINNAIINALQQLSKERAIDTLESSQIEAPIKKPSVEILREIRQEESERLFTKQKNHEENNS